MERHKADGNGRGPRRWLFFFCVFVASAMATAVLAVGGWLGWEYTHRPTLEIRNDTDEWVYVLNDTTASVNVAPHSTATLKIPFLFTAGRLELPDRVCDFDDAKAHEPLVIDQDGAHCTAIHPPATP